MQTIRNIMNTLKGVKAEGPDNWDRLLGCHQALAGMLESMAQETAKAADTKGEA